MRTISYTAETDELKLILERPRLPRTRRVGRHLLQLDSDGKICGLAIRAFTQELKEFRRSRRAVRLAGVLRGIRVPERRIREARRALVRLLEARWDRFS